MAALGAMPLLPACFSARKYAANEKVRLAFVGIGQQGWYDIRQFGLFPRLFECVALCDTDMGAKHTLECLKKYPDVPRFQDFRKMFDAMDGRIDACLIAVPDHSHFPIAMEAMRRGIAVYVEKPLAHTFEECELLMKAAEKYGVVTQMGNQGGAARSRPSRRRKTFRRPWTGTRGSARRSTMITAGTSRAANGARGMTSATAAWATGARTRWIACTSSS